MTITASRGTSIYDVDDQSHLRRAPIPRTLMTSVEHDWLSDVVADWDVVFNEGSTTATPCGASAGWVTACLLGNRPTTFAWRGREPLVLQDTPASGMNWHVVFHRDDLWPSAGASDPDLSIEATGPESPTADIIAAVNTVTHALGVAERDVLAAAGIRDRTYYHWKRNPSTTPRSGSQANLWGVVSSVAGIVAQLDDLTPRWLRADPDRLELFISGQHARLALLAAAAAADVRIPSHTLDEHGVEEESTDKQQLKRFRTRYAVELTHDEDGAPIAQAADLTARFYADEPEEELVLIDVDD